LNAADQAPRIVLIRRDNIGDLVCTTPVIDALRARFPRAYLCACVTGYNRAVLDHNPALDRVVAYTKAKHLDKGQSVLGSYRDRLRLLLDLRRQRFDYCVLAAPGYQARALSMARWMRARHVVGFVERGKPHARLIDVPVSWSHDSTLSEVEDVWGVVRAFGIDGTPGPLRVVPHPDALAHLAPRSDALRSRGRRLIGIHLSARKPSQRWPAERFAALMRALHARHDCAFVLLWAPGAHDDPRHPGDDAKAEEVRAAASGLPLLALPTVTLERLIAAIALCDDFICADGGAMHLAAAAGKPIVCLFGRSDAVRWRPWGVPYRLLQRPNREVGDIGVADVVAAYDELRGELESSVR